MPARSSGNDSESGVMAFADRTATHTESRRKITVHVPVDLLARAQAATGRGVSAAVREGLRMLVTRSACVRLRQLRRKVAFSINLDELREDREWSQQTQAH